MNGDNISLAICNLYPFPSYMICIRIHTGEYGYEFSSPNHTRIGFRDWQGNTDMVSTISYLYPLAPLITSHEQKYLELSVYVYPS